MKRQCHTFSTKFKHDAASLVLDQGHSITEACRSLDIGESALHHWIDQLQAERGGVTLEDAYIESVLRAQIAGVHSLNFTAGLIIMFLFLKSCDLGITEDKTVFSDLFHKGFQTFF